MKATYVLIGCAMILVGAYGTADLLTHSGFSRVETPRLGPWGFLGPVTMLTGLVFVKFQGRFFSRRSMGALVVVGGLFQTLGMLPFIQPRIFGPTPGHAGVGMSEILSGLLMLGGLAALLVSTVLVLADRPLDA